MASDQILPPNRTFTSTQKKFSLEVVYNLNKRKSFGKIFEKQKEISHFQLPFDRSPNDCTISDQGNIVCMNEFQLLRGFSSPNPLALAAFNKKGKLIKKMSMKEVKKILPKEFPDPNLNLFAAKPSYIFFSKDRVEHFETNLMSEDKIQINFETGEVTFIDLKGKENDLSIEQIQNRAFFFDTHKNQAYAQKLYEKLLNSTAHPLVIHNLSRIYSLHEKNSQKAEKIIEDYFSKHSDQSNLQFLNIELARLYVTDKSKNAENMLLKLIEDSTLASHQKWYCIVLLSMNYLNFNQEQKIEPLIMAHEKELFSLSPMDAVTNLKQLENFYRTNSLSKNFFNDLCNKYYEKLKKEDPQNGLLKEIENLKL